ncbi:Ig-like domain repeat protein [Telmatobacter sp. DSM 110680]|uniref:Ig-like domain repeat protein n=1 Tax=Telmatobacter sp. DSM 110680 TaxID=3036704 RepID=A0AAU7DFC4_9BACT
MTAGRPWFSLFAVLCLGYAMGCAVPARAQMPTSSAVQSRITARIDESSLHTLRGNTHPLAQPRNDIGPAPESKVARRLILVLTRSAVQEASLQTWLNSVHDVSSPNYHQWLTPEQFGARFGVSDADLAKVEGWLAGQGFRVNRVAPGRMSLEFSGTTAQVQTAFHTSVHSYLVNGVRHWANTSDPQIPAALAPVVAGVARLNDFNPRPNAIRGPAGIYNPETKRIEPAYTTGDTTNGYTIFVGPADAATIYDTPTTFNANHSGTLFDGTGVTIGIAGDSNIDLQQNANYRATFGLPAKATTVVVDGTDPGENGDAIEAYLDTQVAGGIAPNANVILYTAANTYLDAGLFLAIGRAIDDNKADILNVSFGSCEADQGVAGNQFIYNLWQQAAAQGISVTVSSGDSGSAGCDNPNVWLIAQLGLAVNALASTPYNIAVGGTDFDTLYSNFPSSFTQYVDVNNTLPNHRSALKYIPERPWNDSTVQGYNTTISANVPWTATQYGSNANIVAAGGGTSACVQQSGGVCSAGYPVPSWQAGFASSSTGRNLPDVSFLAGNGLYGAAWGLCTDQLYSPSGTQLPNCTGTPTTGNSFYLTGIGGTSAAAPAFAGMLALLEQKTGGRIGQADYALYDLAKNHYSSVFHDVQTGNNSVVCENWAPDCAVNGKGYYFITGYNAGTGFDEASGLGSVDATQMLSNWAGAGLVGTSSSLTLNGSTAPLSITHGNNVAVNVDVTASSSTPAGDVALVDSINPATVPNSGSIGSFTLASGIASGTTESLPGGSYSVSAHYGGSPTFAQSDSNLIPVKVSAETSSTNLTVQGVYEPASGSRISPPQYGYIYLIDAQPYGNSASAANPNGDATGTITFKNGSTTLGTIPLGSDGIAELQTSTITPGSDSLTAVFPGDASFQASTSAPVALTVQPMMTEVLLNTSGSFYINLGDSITINAKLVNFYNLTTLDSLGAAPTGTITLTDQTANTTLATLPINGTAGSATAIATGTVTYTTSALGAGQHNIAASYSGDGNYAASQPSPGDLITVNGAAAAMTVTPSLNPAKNDQPLQVTISVSQSGTYPVPTGTITLTAFVVSSPLFHSSAVPLVNGSATITIPANTLPIGSVVLNSVYSGDKNYNNNSLGYTLQVISSGTITPSVSLTPPAGIQTSYPFSIPIVVAGASGSPTPTGNVSLSISGNSWGSQPLVNGSTTFVINNNLPGGSNSVTATYLGDSIYTSGTASGLVRYIAMSIVQVNPSSADIAVNQSLTLAVAVGGNYTVGAIPAPTGTVTFTSGTYSSAATPLNNGFASITIPANTLAVGTDSFNMDYSGDANYLAGSGFGIISVTTPIPAGFNLVGSNPSFLAGATTGNTSAITISPTGGFTGNVTMTAAITSNPAGAQNLPTLSFGTTSPVNVTDATGGTATLTITTKAATTAMMRDPQRPSSLWFRAGGAVLACLLFLGIPTRRRSSRNVLGMLALLMILVESVLACGGGGGSIGGGGGTTTIPGTTAGNYTVTVTGTSGIITSTTTITLSVH